MTKFNPKIAEQPLTDGLSLNEEENVFSLSRFRYQWPVAVKMLRHDKQLWKWKTFKSFSKFLFSKDGFIRAHIPAYKAFFQQDFHPWEIDNSSLLKSWQEKLQPAVAVA